MLHELYSLERLHEILLPCEQWYPHPRAEDRKTWTGLSREITEELISASEMLLGCDWPTLSATLMLEFKRSGNRHHFEDAYFKRRDQLLYMVLAECIQYEGRFIDDIINGIWAICEESTWCLSSHVGPQRYGYGLPDTTEPMVALFSAQTAELMSWTIYLLGARLDQESPLIRQRVEREVTYRIINPAFARNDFGWMGYHGRSVNNWNPWICSNWLIAGLLLERDADQRVRMVFKLLGVVDRFIDGYGMDGGCDEGALYWGQAGGSLFDVLEVLYHATEGKLNVFDDEKICNMGKFIYRIHIHNQDIVNFGDGSALAIPQGGLVYRYGSTICDEKMKAFGAWLLQQRKNVLGSRLFSLDRILKEVFAWDNINQETASQPYCHDVWLSDIEVMVARDNDGDERGLYLAAKGGNNGVSHNHNDIGNFIIYSDGKPIFVDAGVEVYSKKTFGPKRYEIWTMQSQYHNVPTLNGYQQCVGETYRAHNIAYCVDKDRAELQLNIAQAYPQEAGVMQLNRIIKLVRNSHIEISDQFELHADQVSITQHLLTACDIKESSKPGLCWLLSRPLPGKREAGCAILEYDPTFFSLEHQRIEITDSQLREVWGDYLIRINLKAINCPTNGSYTLKISQSLRSSD